MLSVEPNANAGRRIQQVDAEYVARMEDLLDLYAEEPDPNRPVVYWDLGSMRSMPSIPRWCGRINISYGRINMQPA
jgi:hypothetical protein